MPRKRTPEQSSTESEATVATITGTPETTQPIEENPTFAERVGRKSDRPAAPDPFELAGDYGAGVRLFEGRRDRQMAIQFDEKPGQPVIDKLREAGYRWNPSDRVWTHPIRQEFARSIRIEANRLFQEVRQMLRQEKSIDTRDEIPF